MHLRRLTQPFSFIQKIREIPLKYTEAITKARNFYRIYRLKPSYGNRTNISPTATLAAEINIGSDVTIGHGTVIRGDLNSVKQIMHIYIGNNCVLHTASSSPTGLQAHLQMEHMVVIGNNCTLYSCTIMDHVYVGHGSVILEGAVLQAGSIIAPNSVVPPGRVVPASQVWGGNPIKYIRNAYERENYIVQDYEMTLFDLWDDYNHSFLPYRNNYLFKENTPDQSVYRFGHIPAKPKHRKWRINPFGAIWI